MRSCVTRVKRILSVGFVGCWHTLKHLTHAQVMKVVTVELRCSSSLFGKECQKSKQDVPVDVEGPKDGNIEG